MVWGCFSWNGIGTLAPIDGIMNANKFIDIPNKLKFRRSSVKHGSRQRIRFTARQ